MLRYRVFRRETGHYIVLPTVAGDIPAEETFATRAAARAAADRLNGLLSDLSRTSDCEAVRHALAQCA
jgi:hypothetical protein